MKKKKILITGGSGLFGRTILKFFLSKKKYSISIVYNSNKIKTKLGKSYKCDLRIKNDVTKLIKKVNPTKFMKYGKTITGSINKE